MTRDERHAVHKEQAAARAVELVRSGMAVGLGAGSTARIVVEKLAAALSAGLVTDVAGVPCDGETEALARRLGVPLVTLEDRPVLDLTVDGADEVDPHLDLIKGAGGALLREKIVAQASRREVIVVDDSKLSPRLGTRRPLPVEILPFGAAGQRELLESLGARVSPRRTPGGDLFRTAQGNFIFDCDFGVLDSPEALARRLEGRAGIVAHGLFLRLATDVIVAGDEGVRHLTRAR